MRKKQQELDEVKKSLAVEVDRKNKDEDVKRNLRKEVTTLEEKLEDLDRDKANAERSRKKLEGELADVQAALESEQVFTRISIS